MINISILLISSPKVKEIRSISCKANVDSGPVVSETDGEEQALQDKQFIANHCLRESGDARYCIKVRYIT